MEYHELAIKRIGDAGLMVFYHNPKGIDSKLDNKFRALAEQAGYKFYASGYDMESKVRDLAFKKE